MKQTTTTKQTTATKRFVVARNSEREKSQSSAVFFLENADIILSCVLI